MTDILVPANIVIKCRKKAKAVVKNANAKGMKEKYSKGAISKDKQIEISTCGFVAEVAMCIYLGMDYLPILAAHHDKPDGGFDIKAGDKTVDVKASPNQYASRLMWPVTKMDKLPHAADVFVLAVVPPRPTPHPEGQPVRLAGWTTRDEFIAQHWKAQGISGIVDGTPYMNEKSLYSMEQIVQHLGHVPATT